MGFKFNVTANTTTAGKDRVEVNWGALNEETIAAAGTKDKARSIPGIISGIYDLGEQNREDAEVTEGGPWDEARKAQILADKPETYWETGRDGKEVMRYPQKPVQQVAIAVDFPQIMVDKGKHFGKSNPQPLRLILNGEFTLSNGDRVVGRPYSVVHTKYDDGTWAFAKNNGLHKLAAAAEVLDGKGYFKSDNIGDLLGKAALFQFRVYMKPNKKDPSKSYYTEEIKLSGIIPEGLVVPEFNEEILHGVNLHTENDEASVKQLRATVKTTIQRANNYRDKDGKLCPLGEMIEANAPQGQKPEEKADDTPPVKPVETGIEPNLEDDVPFAPIGLMEGRLFLHMI